MKKIFILPILIAPIVATADDPVGPSAVGKNETPVIATANAPYATAGAETGDTTNVVSASYVKGAYNDAIAAVNNIARIAYTNMENIQDIQIGLDFKQDEILSESGNQVGLMYAQTFEDNIMQMAYDDSYEPIAQDYDMLISAGAVLSGINTVLNIKGVNAVTTWGDDSHPTNLQLTTASN